MSRGRPQRAPADAGRGGGGRWPRWRSASWARWSTCSRRSRRTPCPARSSACQRDDLNARRRLRLGRRGREDPAGRHPPGQILATDPAAGEQLREGEHPHRRGVARAHPGAGARRPGRHDRGRGAGPALEAVGLVAALVPQPQRRGRGGHVTGFVDGAEPPAEVPKGIDGQPDGLVGRRVSRSPISRASGTPTPRGAGGAMGLVGRARGRAATATRSRARSSAPTRSDGRARSNRATPCGRDRGRRPGPRCPSRAA